MFPMYLPLDVSPIKYRTYSKRKMSMVVYGVFQNYNHELDI